MDPLATRTGRVAENFALTHEVHRLVLDLSGGPGLLFRSGQYVLFPAPDGGPARPLSIASSPRRPDRLEFCFRTVEDGRVTSALAAVRPGDRVAFSGPYGRFVLRESDERRLFVAAGTGISPIRSMIQDHLEREDPRPAFLVFGNRHPRDLYYREEFERLASNSPSFRFVPAVTRAAPDDPGLEVGRVTEVLPRVLEGPERWSAYLCGGPGMVLDTLRVLVKLGVPEAQCYRES